MKIERRACIKSNEGLMVRAPQICLFVVVTLVVVYISSGERRDKPKAAFVPIVQLFVEG